MPGGHPHRRARCLAQRLRDLSWPQAFWERPPDTGVMDITLYRDDWTLLHQRPKVGTTEIGFDIEQRRVVYWWTTCSTPAARCAPPWTS